MFEQKDSPYLITKQHSIPPELKPEAIVYYQPQIIVLGFSGYRRMGKTLSARLLTESLDPNIYHCVTHNFAEPIRDLCKQFLDLEVTPDMDEKIKESPIKRLGNHSPRQVMQKTGDFFRGIQKDYFTEAMQNKIKSFSPTFPKIGVFMIDDVRFKNETQVVKDFSGEVWETRRFNSFEELDKADELVYDSVVNQNQHSSDIPLPRELIERQIWWVTNELDHLANQLNRAFKERFIN